MKVVIRFPVQVNDPEMERLGVSGTSRESWFTVRADMILGVEPAGKKRAHVYLVNGRKLDVPLNAEVCESAWLGHESVPVAYVEPGREPG